MAGRSRGNIFGRRRENVTELKIDESMDLRSIDAINKEMGEHVLELAECEKHAQKLESDKKKIDAEIKKVENLSIDKADKEALLKELRDGLAELQEQFRREVLDFMEKMDRRAEALNGEMQGVRNALKKQAEELRGEEIEAARKDLTDAAEIAEGKQRQAELRAEAFEAQLSEQYEMIAQHMDEVLNGQN